jgi:hypothetical protein
MASGAILERWCDGGGLRSRPFRGRTRR